VPCERRSSTWRTRARPSARGLHAGGILWYGNHLYVADTTRGIRVFDMRSIFDLAKSPNGDAKDKKRIGRQNGVYYGFGYRYVMPQVDAWVNAAGPDNDGKFACKGTGAPKFSYMSIDRSEVPDRYLSRSHGQHAGQLLLAKPDASPQGTLQATDARPAAIGPEDLSFWPGHKEVWTVTEHAGRRVLYAAPG
jgi:hypothetical protein